MLVEDDAVVAMVVEEMLIERGYDVLVTSNLDDALHDLDFGSFDAAVLDLHLRGDDGLPVAEGLSTRGIPFLFLTGSDTSGLKGRYASAPIVRKPFDRATLESAVAALLAAPTAP
nr:response regulator [Luteibacter sp. Sphag1AF]